MKCPACGSMETKVIDSRTVNQWSAIRRRRLCEFCEKRFTTLERLVITDLVVLKKDDTKELYDQSKLKRALMVAFGKHHASLEQINELIVQLENNRSGQKEITSEQLWKDVLWALKGVNEFAYVRFASVFMKFDGIDDFRKMLEVE